MWLRYRFENKPKRDKHIYRSNIDLTTQASKMNKERERGREQPNRERESSQKQNKRWPNILCAQIKAR